MLKSVDVVHGIIEEQIAKGIPSERIVVGGFSQGGAIALLVHNLSYTTISVSSNL